MRKTIISIISLGLHNEYQRGKDMKLFSFSTTKCYKCGYPHSNVPDACLRCGHPFAAHGYVNPKREERAVDELFDILHNKFKRKKFPSFRLSLRAETDILLSDFSEKSIRRIVKAILGYLGISSAPLEVVVQADRNTSRFSVGGTAGKYVRNGWMNKSVHIALKPSYSLYEVVAILAHECMHHFLWLNGLEHPVEEKNELLVDVAVIYFGFGHYISKGYESISKVKGGTIHTAKLGYISEYQVLHVEKRISGIRSLAR